MSERDAGREIVDLGGTWAARVSDADLVKVFMDPGHDDASWAQVPVPGRWRDAPTLRDSDGPVLYRRAFSLSPPEPGARAFIELDGCAYYGDVWLDGAYLGATEGSFVPHSFEVTDAVRARSDHVVAIEVGWPPQTDRSKPTVTGSRGRADDTASPDNPGGIVRPVRVREVGAVRIDRCRVTCIEATEERGRLLVDVALDAAANREHAEHGELIAVLRDPDGRPVVTETESFSLTDGVSHRQLELVVDRPRRWWPRRLGPAELYTVDLQVMHAGACTDRRTVRTGIRDVRMSAMNLTLNGERMFVAGASQRPLPTGHDEPARARRLVELAVAANLDLLRLHTHVADPSIYVAADEAGLMIWQDAPLRWGYARGVRRAAVRIAAEMVDLLAHHPSIVVWCGHDEPGEAGPRQVAAGSPATSAALTRKAISSTLPRWNKDVLDRAVARALRRADASRPVLKHSGVLPSATNGGTDAHLSFGWRYGGPSDLAAWLRRWPRLARWVSELGAASVPDSLVETDVIAAGSRWPDGASDRLAISEMFAGVPPELLARVPPDESPEFGSWRRATQTYQAAIAQLQIEDLRRLRHRPTGGFCLAGLADADFAITRSLVDAELRPKPVYNAVAAACRPVLAMVEPRRGDVHVVNETRTPLDGVRVDVRVDGALTSFTGDAPAEDVTYVGSVLKASPSAATRITTRLDHRAVGVVNHDYDEALLVLI